MKENRTASPLSLAKSLSLLTRIVEDQAGASLSAIAAEIDIPLSTAHRLATGLEECGYLLRVGRGRYISGPVLARLSEIRRDQAWGGFAERVSRPILARLSRNIGKAVHLGVLEDNMMTYLVKAGDRRGDVVSREGMQLEAYCSGLGKALLAYLPAAALDRYMSSEPFVRLTPTTITSAAMLKRELGRIRKRGYAIDNAEMVPGLICVAVPIVSAQGVFAAISLVATHEGAACNPADYVPCLHEAAQEIESKLFPYGGS